MKEMEQKSVSEARGYVPVVPPHQPTPLSVPSHPTMVDPLPASTSGAGTASVVPGGAPAGKEKEEEEEEKINTTSGETGEVEEGHFFFTCAVEYLIKDTLY